MFTHQQALLLIGTLLLSFPSGWNVLADDCIDLRIHAPTVATCCRHEAFLDPDSFENCFKSVDSQNAANDINAVVCAFDCSYREMGFLQGEDEINVENINSYQAAYDAAYQETIANAVNHCMTTKDSIRQEAELVKTTCSAFAVKFHACIVLEVVANCPAERWTESPICEKVKGGTPMCKA